MGREGEEGIRNEKTMSSTVGWAKGRCCNNRLENKNLTKSVVNVLAFSFLRLKLFSPPSGGNRLVSEFRLNFRGTCVPCPLVAYGVCRMLFVFKYNKSFGFVIAKTKLTITIKRIIVQPTPIAFLHRPKVPLSRPVGFPVHNIWPARHNNRFRDRRTCDLIKTPLISLRVWPMISLFE